MSDLEAIQKAERAALYAKHQPEWDALYTKQAAESEAAKQAGWCECGSEELCARPDLEAEIVSLKGEFTRHAADCAKQEKEGVRLREELAERDKAEAKLRRSHSREGRIGVDFDNDCATCKFLARAAKKGEP